MNDTGAAESGSTDRRWADAIKAMDSGDAEGSLFLLKTLAAEGDIPAMIEVGVIYETGPGKICEDIEKAKVWYERAAQEGSVEGLLAVARLHFSGDGYLQDYGVARQYYEKIVAEVEDRRALFGLGWIFYEGLGVTPDHEKAADLFTRATLMGHLLAPKWLARLYWSNGKYISAIRYWGSAIFKIWRTALLDRNNMKLHRHL